MSKLSRRLRRLAVLVLPPILVRASSAGLNQVRRTGLRAALRSASRLQLGCGPNVIPGWANLDLDGGPGSFFCDLTHPLPVRSASIDFIYSEHFIEHISREEGQALFRECRRVMKPGAVLRVSTPDLGFLISEYLNGRVEEWQDMDWRPETPCQLVNEGVRFWGHQHIYDFDELYGALMSAGFATVDRVSWRESRHAELRGMETRPQHSDLIIEAVA